MSRSRRNFQEVIFYENKEREPFIFSSRFCFYKMIISQERKYRTQNRMMKTKAINESLKILFSIVEKLISILSSVDAF